MQGGYGGDDEDEKDGGDYNSNYHNGGEFDNNGDCDTTHPKIKSYQPDKKDRNLKIPNTSFKNNDSHQKNIKNATLSHLGPTHTSMQTKLTVRR